MQSMLGLVLAPAHAIAHLLARTGIATNISLINVVTAILNRFLKSMSKCGTPAAPAQS
jgi:hypothetical protein